MRMIFRHLYDVGELLNVGFDVQDLFVQVTVVIHLKSTVPRQIHDRRRRPFTVLRQGMIATLRDGMPASRLSNGSFWFPNFDLKSTRILLSL
jgi:hypothetical protein